MTHYTYEQFYQLPEPIRGNLVSTRELAQILGVTSTYISEISRNGIIKPYCVVSINGKSKHPCRYFDKQRVMDFFDVYNTISGYKQKQEFASKFWND